MMDKIGETGGQNTCPRIFGREIICLVPDIEELIREKYGTLDKQTYVKATKLLYNAHRRVKQIN